MRDRKTVIWCSESVPARQGYAYYACGKPAKYDPDKNGNPTKCGTHCAAAVERRKTKQREEYKKWCARRDAERSISKIEQKFEETLRRIASGHNDPRTLAQELIGELDYNRNTLKALLDG